MKTALDTSHSTVDLIRPTGQIPGSNKLHDTKELALELGRSIREIRTLYQGRNPIFQTRPQICAVRFAESQSGALEVRSPGG